MRLSADEERLGKDSALAGVESKQTNLAQGAGETSQDFSSAKGIIANVLIDVCLVGFFNATPDVSATTLGGFPDRTYTAHRVRMTYV